MSTDSIPQHFLPDELDRALRRATDRTLGALTALRHAVRDHVQHERARGSHLGAIQLGLRDIIARALDGLSLDGSAGRDPDDLAKQIIGWSEDFYAEQSHD